MKQSDDTNKAATLSTTRLVLDCRQINKKIKPSFNFLHDLDYVIQRVQSFRGKSFSTLDIKNAFYSIELDEKSQRCDVILRIPGGDQRIGLRECRSGYDDVSKCMVPNHQYDFQRERIQLGYLR